jgi:signal transduction histidine kinase
MLANQIIFVLFWVIVAYTIILFGFLVLLIPYTHKLRQLKYQAGLVEIKTDYERQLLLSKLEIQEETLQNVSRELHDNIGQKLYLLKLYLGIFDSGSPIQYEHVETLDAYLTEAAEDLHELLTYLNLNLVKKGGLLLAIQDQIRQLEKTALYTVSFNTQGAVEGIPAQHEILLFRIFQEALNNIIRHAAASHIDVRLDRTTEGVSLSIRDDGRGFHYGEGAVVATSSNRGKGLQNMVERARLMNGRLVITSSPGEGTRIDISICL